MRAATIASILACQPAGGAARDIPIPLCPPCTQIALCDNQVAACSQFPDLRAIALNSTTPEALRTVRGAGEGGEGGSLSQTAGF